ncbi:S-adenosyl-L-methionine-dependent methyltransferase [Ramicandelaber brevisporus]|nr:S-adenosyl-L-methionine-dependent methyltransferase [Ramicandelaber brevisporus]
MTTTADEQPVKQPVKELQLQPQQQEIRNISTAASVGLLFCALGIQIILATVLSTAPRYVEPIYGNVFAYGNFTVVSLVMYALGAWFGFMFTRVALSNPPFTDSSMLSALSWAIDIGGILLACTPQRTEYTFTLSDWLGPVWGPHVTQLTLAYPVIIAIGFCAGVAGARIAYNKQSVTRTFVVAAVFTAVIGTMAVLFAGAIQNPPSCEALKAATVMCAILGLIFKLLNNHEELVVDSITAAVSAENELVKPAEEASTASSSSATETAARSEPAAEVRKRSSGKSKSKSKSADSETSAPTAAEQPAESSEPAKPQQQQQRKQTLRRFMPTMAIFFVLWKLFNPYPQCYNGVVPVEYNPHASNWTTVFRQESVTGWVSVVEEDHRDVRLLRSGHSIIGGVFRKSNESVFPSFYFMEAGRLAANRQKSKVERALQIGLGIGATATSLHKQRVKVDVVEIDPAVYHAALKYFNLPDDLHRVFIQDGRKFIQEAQTATYDYVLHDVFTGGSVPPSLFSVEALSHIKRIMKPDTGILSLNFIGSQAPPVHNTTMAHVTHTLKHVFKHVVCYREGASDPNGFLNYVYFASDTPIEFKYPLVDVLDMESPMTRLHALLEMTDNEADIRYDEDKVQLIRDQDNVLNKMLVPAAQAHWEAMRKMFPMEFWLNY